MLGYEEDELVNSSFLDLVHSDDLHDTIHAMAALGKGKKVVDFENRFKTKSGKYVWLQWRSHTAEDDTDTIYGVAREITPVTIPQRKGEPVAVTKDEHPRAGTTIEALAKLPTPFRKGGTVTAGNASGVNDGAAALVVASEAAAKKYGLRPIARILGGAAAGVAPRIMGIGPAPASKRVLAKAGLTLSDIDVIEINEAFASQSLATLRELGLPDDADHVNPNGGAIALGHPLGMSGARLVLTAIEELHQRDATRALAAMCIGVGQGIASVVERV